MAESSRACLVIGSSDGIGRSTLLGMIMQCRVLIG
jgi:NAD(P)-dependent dehydrogenase (short-subunit alcohol dehydrogenase family)